MPNLFFMELLLYAGRHQAIQEYRSINELNWKKSNEAFKYNLNIPSRIRFKYKLVVEALLALKSLLKIRLVLVE